MIYLLLLFCTTFAAQASQMSQSEAINLEQQAQAQEKRRAAQPAQQTREKTINPRLNKKMWAAVTGNKLSTLCRMFLGKNIPDINSFSEEDLTPLQWAVFRNHYTQDLYDMIAFLLQKGADSSKTSQEFPSPFEFVVAHKNIDLLKIFAAEGIRPTQDVLDRSLVFAARHSKLEFVKLLLEMGADIHAQPSKRLYASPHSGTYVSETQFPSSPLLAAMWNPAGDKDFINYLMSHGADPNQKNESYLSPLMIAVSQHKYAIVELLLHHGANPNAKDSAGRTIYDIAETDPELKRILYGFVKKHQLRSMGTTKSITSQVQKFVSSVQPTKRKHEEEKEDAEIESNKRQRLS